MTQESLTLAPMPQKLQLAGGAYRLKDGMLIILAGSQRDEMLFSARRFQNRLREQLNLSWEINSSENPPKSKWGLVMTISPETIVKSQGYVLEINENRISIIANNGAGAFYGVCTLLQLLDQRETEIPCLYITDWPNFPARGVMLDISRDKVPTLETLYSLIDKLAGWKVNQFQLYTEHTFKYYQHPDVWKKASPISGDEILALDQYCQKRYIELVPNQNSFGHMQRWLIHPKYAPLAEVGGGFDVPWGHMEGPFSLCPIDPGSIELIYSLYEEVLPHFTSRMFNVGCDETFDLGQGKSKEACDKAGKGRVYLEFLLKIYQYVHAQNRTMQFWGDIILQHPELISELPRDVIALDWGYEADHPFDSEGIQFAKAGIPFYVCPGTSSWNTIIGRTENTLGNLKNAAEHGLKHGAIGYLNTDWGDNGHWQPLPVSYLGYLCGAAYSWAFEANRDLDVPRALDLFAFRDVSGIMGQLVYDLGNVYKTVGFEPSNSSALFSILQHPLGELRAYTSAFTVNFSRPLDIVEEALLKLKKTDMKLPDRDLILAEYELACKLIRHACLRGKLAHNEGITFQKSELTKDLQNLIPEYEQAWLRRNRIGGLEDSTARFRKLFQDYAT